MDIGDLRKEIENALKFCGRKLKTHLNKKVQRNHIKEKFEIVQKVLPKLAERTALVVKKPEPNLEPVIAKIMDIVWIEDSIKFESNCHKASITINNYTAKNRKFKVLVEVPFSDNLRNIIPEISQWNFDSMKEAREFMENLFDEDEGAKLQITPNQDGRSISWKVQEDDGTPIPQEKEMRLSEGLCDKIAKFLKQLNDREQLEFKHYSLYEKFVGE